MTQRIQLLPPHEIKDLYALPVFLKDDQEFFFEITPEITSAICQYTTVKTKLYFLLQLGYFKVKHQFYLFTFEDVQDDVNYLLKTYFQTTDSVQLNGRIARNNIHKQRKTILQLYEYRAWNKLTIALVETRLSQLMKTHPRHNDALRELFVFFQAQKIILPSYRSLQNLFTGAVSREKQRLTKLISQVLPESARNALDEFFKRKDSISKLAVLKSDQRNFQFKALKKEVEKLKEIKPLYWLSKEILPILEISKNCIAHYCELVTQYSVFRLTQFSHSYSRLYLICYIYHRYQQISDYLVITFQHHIKKMKEHADDFADMKEQLYNANNSLNLPHVAHLLRWMVSDAIKKETPYSTVLEGAFKILPSNQFNNIADFIDKKTFNKESLRWEFYGRSSRKIAIYIRSIFLVIDFSHNDSESALIKAIYTLQTHLIAGKTSSQLDISNILKTLVTTRERSYLYHEQNGIITIDFARLEFLIYKKIQDSIELGTLFCSDSLSYKNLQDDFVSRSIIDQKVEIVKNLGYPRILTFYTQRLSELDQRLHDLWIETNYNISVGNNNAIKYQSKDCTKWSLSYQKNETQDETSIFDKLPQAEISDIASYIFKKYNVIKVFSHIKPYRSKQEFDLENILACIFASAFGCSLNKMSEISDLNLNELRSTYTNAIRLDTLKKANDCIADQISMLEIFKDWNIIPEKLLSDSDGQKFESKHQTIQSRYSSKYFGLNKGIVPYTLVANHIPINSRIISPNEHESHFTFDILYNNKSNIEPDMITGDMHSINQLNFFILDMINVDFVPNYKDLYDKSKQIYSLRNPKQYQGLLKPAGQINLNILKEQNENIETVLLSLIMQETTQSTIVRKLSSHKRYSRLKKALWEYNKILSSIHLLNLINNSELRRNIKNARNRTEAYHQLQSTIRKVHGGKFNGRTIIENEIWNQAARLVANFTIAYNATILNKLSRKNVALKERITKVSPIAWQHINFTGKYSFKDKTKYPDLGKIIATLEALL